MITLNFRRAVEQVVQRMLTAIIAPNTVACGEVTTSGTAETTLITLTLTAPPVAGQLLLTAHFSLIEGTVGDVFYIRLYIAGVNKSLAYYGVKSVISSDVITIVGQGPVTTAAGQIVKVTCQRIGGVGTIKSLSGFGHMSWLILPGAGTTP